MTNGVYILRPEVLESNFYAFRVTGDTKYLDRAAAAVKSFNEFLATPNGFAALNDVTNPSLGLIDDTESFWFAEALKYLWVFSLAFAIEIEHGARNRYLTFDDPEHIHLDRCVYSVVELVVHLSVDVITSLLDVLNTEAHPFEAPPAKSRYGSGKILPLVPGFTAQSAGAPLPAISPNAKVGPAITNTGEV